MPDEIENIEQSHIKFDKNDVIFLMVTGLIIFIVIYVLYKILT